MSGQDIKAAWMQIGQFSVFYWSINDEGDDSADSARRW